MTYTQVWDHMTNAPSEKVIKRDEDGAFIPFDEGNRDYRDYLAWLEEEGNAPNPASRPPGASSAPRVELPEPMDPVVKQYVDDLFAQLKGE